MGPGGMQGDTKYTLQCSGSYNSPLVLEHGLRPGPRIHVHIWQNTPARRLHFQRSGVPRANPNSLRLTL